MPQCEYIFASPLFDGEAKPSPLFEEVNRMIEVHHLHRMALKSRVNLQLRPGN